MKKFIIAATFALGTLAGIVTSADAKIEPVDVSCTNPAGHLAGGQQPTCSGAAQEQETENQNPAGHAPGGHN